ncbi:hypothetical protein BpHYR1_005133 [Brachionus plicatilis]|uniref:Uncharacterized protein n=1 Tax=Brachionus plicatilis TaxID=10195 RepID=A0A3M7SPG5_BRAPC|nr:hypothetical protein BpHYR1_005133 [Brachionus plicatilis]
MAAFSPNEMFICSSSSSCCCSTREAASSDFFSAIPASRALHLNSIWSSLNANFSKEEEEEWLVGGETCAVQFAQFFAHVNCLEERVRHCVGDQVTLLHALVNPLCLLVQVEHQLVHSVLGLEAFLFLLNQRTEQIVRGYVGVESVFELWWRTQLIFIDFVNQTFFVHVVQHSKCFLRACLEDLRSVWT